MFERCDDGERKAMRKADAEAQRTRRNAERKASGCEERKRIHHGGRGGPDRTERGKDGVAYRALYFW